MPRSTQYEIENEVEQDPDELVQISDSDYENLDDTDNAGTPTTVASDTESETSALMSNAYGDREARRLLQRAIS